MLPGTRIGPEMLAHWPGLIPGLEVRPLPGFKGPMLARWDLEAFVDHFAATLPVGALVVGESLSGLIALGLAGRGWRAVAFDPPLAMAKQWSVQRGVRRILAVEPPEHPIHRIAPAVFGVMADGSQEERIYYPLLERLRASVDVVTGTVPLWPYGGAPGRACCIDAADRWVLARFTLASVHTIVGPHNLLSENIEACRELILQAASGVRAA